MDRLRSRSLLAVAGSVFLFVCTVAQNASAVPVYGLSATLTGERSVGAGLIGEGTYAGSAFSIAWEITYNAGDGTYDYSYTLDGFSGISGGGVSLYP